MLSRYVFFGLYVVFASKQRKAPEQTGGMESTSEDNRTDLYSLGIMFWTLLGGRGVHPFEGGPLELLHAIVQKRPMPVHEVRRVVPQVLALIIDKVTLELCHITRDI